MAKTTIADLPAKLYALLSGFTPEERSRVVQATLVLFGEGQTPPTVSKPMPGNAGNASVPDAIKYFHDKDPKNKGELFAVAARYREITGHGETHSKADFKAVIDSARRNFDERNYARDLENAKRQAGFFNLGTDRDATKLSYYGQQYVDALPDRDAASKLRRPKVRGRTNKSTKRGQG